MNIRISSEMDNAQLKSIFKYNLNCSDAYADWYAERCKPYTATLVAEEGGKIKSVLEWTAYSMMINHVPAHSAYISNITTLPEYRGNGYARALLTKAVADMYDMGKSVCFAVPPSYKMFDKFGFRLTHQYKQYNIDIKNIPNYTIRGSVERVTTNEAMIAVISGIYDRYTADKNGYIVRTPQNWLLILDDLQNNFGGYVALVRNNAGEPVGYLMYIMSGREMHIYETAYINHSAYASIMAYIRSHITQADKVMLKAPADDLAYLDFCDNRTAVGLYPFVTSRIVNVPAALTAAIYTTHFDQNLTLKVIDRIESRNDGTFIIDGGKIVKSEQDVENADIICDIGTLTQLYLGFLSPSEAKKLNLLSGDISKITDLFCKKDNFINMLIV